MNEEQEDLGISQEGEQLQGLEEAGPNTTFTAVCLKSEEDDSVEVFTGPQSSQLHANQTKENRDPGHLKTEADGEDCGESEPNRDSSQNSDIKPSTHGPMSHFEYEIGDSCVWKETRGSESDPNSFPNTEVHVSDKNVMTGKLSASPPECATTCSQEKEQDRIQIDEKPFCCSACGKRYGKKKSLRDHMLRHGNGQGWSCLICRKNFPQRRELNNHMKTHVEQNPFRCSICGKLFKTKSGLFQHTNLHSGVKPYGCHICGKKFAQKSVLNNHRRVHTGEKPFSCSVCDKKFSDRKSWQTHHQAHLGVRPHTCSICEAHFPCNAHLKRHVKIHTEKEPFGCPACGQKFPDRSAWLTHLNLHKRAKPFRCSICGANYSRRKQCVAHMRVHIKEGGKSFGCPVCGITFTEHEGLVSHLPVHTGEKLFKCDACIKKYATLEALIKHKCIL